MSRLPIRVALVADLREEQWPSMDLVADMLFEQLRERSRGGMFSVELLRPAFPGRGRTVGRYVNRFFDYPRWLRQRAADFDVFHIVDHSYAHLVHVVPPARTVVTCHDVDAFMPLVDPAVVATRLPRMMTRTIASGMRRAACVTCVSDTTRREVAALELADPDRLVVIPNGVQPAIAAAPSPHVDGALEHLLGEREAGTIELLHVGSCIPRKRIDLLLDVMAAISAEVPRVRLLKAGGQLTPGQKAQACRLGIANAIVQLPFLSPEMLAALYRRADAVLVTSSREGFGLPVIEALAAGTPVIASDLPVLREVGGSVVTYAPLDDIYAWRDAVLRAIAHRIARTGALIGTGAAVSTHAFESDSEQRRERTRHAARFSWADAAAQLSRVYERIAANA